MLRSQNVEGPPRSSLQHNSSFFGKFRSHDLFGQSPTLRLESQSQMNSLTGACCTMLVYILFIFHNYIKMQQLLDDMPTSFYRNFVQMDDQDISFSKFGTSNGFNLAVALVSSNIDESSKHVPLDPSYGELVFSVLERGPDINYEKSNQTSGEFGTYEITKPLKMKPCNLQSLPDSPSN